MNFHNYIVEQKQEQQDHTWTGGCYCKHYDKISSEEHEGALLTLNWRRKETALHELLYQWIKGDGREAEGWFYIFESNTFNCSHF